MKKIVFIIENAYHYAGTEKVCDFMTEALGEEAEITILSLKGSGVPFYKLSRAKKIVSLNSFKSPLVKAIRYINHDKPDFVFLISMGKLSVFFSFLAMFILKRKNKKLTRFISCEHVSLSSYSKLIKILKFIFLRFYNDVVVLTENDKNKLFSWGISSKVIFNAINYNDYEKKGKDFTALSVGRLEAQKGFDILLPIWKRFSETNPNWKLVIAGDGCEKENLIILCETLGISKTVDFVGVVHNVDDYLKKADIYIMTSRYEGLPLVLLEAKSWALPCIAFDCPTGPKEIIFDRRDGFLVPLGDDDDFLEKLDVLANDDKLRLSFSKETKITSRKFDKHKIVQQWKDIIK